MCASCHVARRFGSDRHVHTRFSLVITGIKPRRGKRTPRKDSRPPIRTLILAFSILGDEDPTKNPRTYFVRILCACACIVLLFFLFMAVITFRDFYKLVSCLQNKQDIGQMSRPRQTDSHRGWVHLNSSSTTTKKFNQSINQLINPPTNQPN